MKLIEKKSIVPLPEASGSISDTTNITDKTTNTYSARVIDEKDTGIKTIINNFKNAIGIGNENIPQLYNVDINNIDLSGVRYISHCNYGGVGDFYGYLFQVVYNSTYKLQIFTDWHSTTKIMYRKCQDGTWGEWYTITSAIV